MTAEERRELEKLVDEDFRRYRDAQMARRCDEGRAVSSAVEYCQQRLRATLDRLTDEQSGEPEPAWSTDDARMVCAECGHDRWTWVESNAPTTEPEEVMPDDGVRPERSEPDVTQGERLEYGYRTILGDPMDVTQALSDLDESIVRTADGAPIVKLALSTDGTMAALVMIRIRHLHRSPDSRFTTHVRNEVSKAVADKLDREIRRDVPDSHEPDSHEPEDAVVERVARWLAYEQRQLVWRHLHEGSKVVWRDTARRLLHDTGILPGDK